MTEPAAAPEYVIVPKGEYELLKSEIVLTSKDAEELLEYQDVFLKFLEKTRFSYQIELAKGTHRGKEEKVYIAIEIIEEIKKGLQSIERAFKRYQQEQENK